MANIYYEAVFVDCSFRRYEKLEDIPIISFAFIVKKEETYSCQTYSDFNATLIDRNGKHGFISYKGYSFSSFRVAGPARNHCLYLSYEAENGEHAERVFRADLSYNHAGEDFSPVKTEWDGLSQYKVIFDFFDNLKKYGPAAYDRILELEREVYAKDAAYRQSEESKKEWRKSDKLLRECITEVFIPKGWIDVPEGPFYDLTLKTIHIPSTVQSICLQTFGLFNGNTEVFCMAIIPPRLYGGIDWLRVKMGATLYVPKESLNAYLNDEQWASAFNVIKGIEEESELGSKIPRPNTSSNNSRPEASDYSHEELDDMYRDAYEGEPDAEWNTD